MAFSTQFRRVLTAAFLVLALAAAAGAFAVGFTGALTHSLTDPTSAPALRLTALSRLDDSLGYGGFLKTYRELLLAGDGSQDRELQGLADEAEASLAAFLSASASDADRGHAESLRAAVAPFRRMALFSAGSGSADSQATELAPLPELERSYAALKAEIATAADSARRAPLENLSTAFVWAQAMSVAALWFLAAILFALAWLMRDRLVAPLERLRGSVNGAAGGAMSDPVWGIDRNDEVGGIARAAERLRQAANSVRQESPAQDRERSAEGTEKLGDDLANVAGIAIEAQARIEAASIRAAKASQTALEAAGIAREGSARLAERAETMLELTSKQTNAVLVALAAAVARLSEAAAQIEQPSADQNSDRQSGPASRHAAQPIHPVQDGTRFDRAKSDEKEDSDAVIEDLVADLEALERFAQERTDIASDKAMAMTATLIETIDRLNVVAGRISATAGERRFRATG